jgi:hypothetical protein
MQDKEAVHYKSYCDSGLRRIAYTILYCEEVSSVLEPPNVQKSVP